MDIKAYRVCILAFMLVVALSFGTACTAEDSDPDPDTANPPAATAPADEDPPADGDDVAMTDREFVELECSMCHTTDRVWNASYDKSGWETNIDRMKSNGLVISDEEYVRIVDYLTDLSEE